jgi:hypothetical protein
MLIGGTVTGVWIKVLIATRIRLDGGFDLNILHRPLLASFFIEDMLHVVLCDHRV